MFTYVTTEDGSPTVRIQSTTGTEDRAPEAMHSLRGAFSETLYIYGTAIETALSKDFPARVLSMGLGLGYVEILATALFLKHGSLKPGGESFEIVPELRDWFRAWATQSSAQVPAPFRAIYDQILARTAEATGQDSAKIHDLLGAMINDGRWVLSEALTPATEFEKRFGCICFDAFSSKSTPDLWTEEFLKSFFERAAEPRCVLSTYACTGALKRTLREARFVLEIRQGFASKRDSTFAVRDSTNEETHAESVGQPS